MTDETFDAFKTRKMSEGYDQVLVREWDPDFANEPHDHPFDTDAFVAKGEYWLNLNGHTTHYKTGDVFKVNRGVLHSEEYGPAGAVFWAARKN
ncbi:MAG: AraC family ligand binding domain-containing protein [Burkholderiaceae bacterium]